MTLLNLSNLLKVIQLTLWAVFLTAVTGIFGAIPLQTLRQSILLKDYTLIALTTIILMILLNWTILAFSLFFFYFLIGTYNEFLKTRLSFFLKMIGTSTITLLITGGAFLILFSTREFKNAFLNLISSLKSQSEVVKRFSKFNSYLGIEATPQLLLSQIPSLVFIFTILALLFSLLFEKKILQLFRIRKKQTKHFQFLDLRIPQAFIWIFILSFFLSFYKDIPKVLKWASLNVFATLLFLYFLRGLVISLKFFNTFKIRNLWRIAWLALFIFKLPVSFSALGFLDFWVDFEKKIKLYKRKKQKTSKSNRENEL